MKKTIALILIITLLLALTACSSNKTEEVTSPTEQISPSESETETISSTENERHCLEGESFEFIVGEDTIYNKDNPMPEEATGINFNVGYIAYEKPGTNSSHSLMKLKPGDKLDNGLTVQWASTGMSILDDGYHLSQTIIGFEGHLTLTGTLNCMQDDLMYGKNGGLSFAADDSNDIRLPSQPGDCNVFGAVYDLGYIDDENLPEKITEIVNTDGKETAKVRVVIKDITIHGSFFKTGTSDTATLVSIEEVA